MDTSLKQRLIGAVVLIALAVIFLPMLIKGPAPDSGVSDVPLDVPAAPGGEYETRELPLVTPGATPANGAVGMAGASPDAANPDAADAADAAPAATAAATAGGNYVVSFGAYASAQDADKVIASLRDAQLPGFTEPATINGKPAFRVRIGPYADQATAESARLQASQLRSDVNAKVVVLDAQAEPAATTAVTEPAAATTQPLASTPAPAASQPAASKPADKPAAEKPAEKPAAKPEAPASKPVASTPPPAPKPAAAASVGFAVQLGAFSKAADAEALRDKVRAGGFSAFVEQVRTDQGTLHRVRVGPVADRAEADSLKAQVAAKFGINGMVRPHP